MNKTWRRSCRYVCAAAQCNPLPLFLPSSARGCAPADRSACASRGGVGEGLWLTLVRLGAALSLVLGALPGGPLPSRAQTSDIVPAGALETINRPEAQPPRSAQASPTAANANPAQRPAPGEEPRPLPLLLPPPISTTAQAQDRPAPPDKPKPERLPPPRQDTKPDEEPEPEVPYQAVLPPQIETHPIDICTALKLAETDNPTMGVARQAIQEALANQLQADVLLLPTLRAGSNYHNHQGILQTSFGLMRQVDSSSLYAGGGARTLAAETVAFPMVQVFSPLADAFLAPLIARRQVTVRSAESAAIANQMLLEVADRFLELAAAEAEFGALRRSERDMGEIVRLTTAFAKVGRGRPADEARARSEALLLRVEVQRAEERVAVASANLAELLNLDPSCRLKPPAEALGLLQLIDPSCDVCKLVEEGQALRPEIAAIRAEIARRDAQVKQEKVRPFLPTLSLGVSTGTFGGGTDRTDLVTTNPSFGRFSGRVDVNLIAYWTALNMGAGNVALVGQRLAERREASYQQLLLLNQIREEVTSAYAQTRAATRRFQVAQVQLEVAQAGFLADRTRIRGGEGLPIEIINSANRLITARVNLIATILEFNRAQFALFVALGSRPTTVCPLK